MKPIEIKRVQKNIYKNGKCWGWSQSHLLMPKTGRHHAARTKTLNWIVLFYLLLLLNILLFSLYIWDVISYPSLKIWMILFYFVSRQPSHNKIKWLNIIYYFRFYYLKVDQLFWTSLITVVFKTLKNFAPGFFLTIHDEKYKYIYCILYLSIHLLVLTFFYNFKNLLIYKDVESAAFNITS